MGTSLKGKNLLPEGANSFLVPRGSEFFPLRAVAYTIENHFYHIKRPPLNFTFYITHVRNCVIGASPMHTLAQPDQCLRSVRTENALAPCCPPSTDQRLIRLGRCCIRTGEGAQWLSDRVLDSRPRDRGFEPHWRHCVESFSKTN